MCFIRYFPAARGNEGQNGPDACKQNKHQTGLPELKLELRVKVQVKFQWGVFGNLDAASECVDFSFFRQTDDNRLRSGFCRVLMLNQSPRDLLQNSVVLCGISSK